MEKIKPRRRTVYLFGYGTDARDEVSAPMPSLNMLLEVWHRLPTYLWNLFYPYIDQYSSIIIYFINIHHQLLFFIYVNVIFTYHSELIATNHILSIIPLRKYLPKWHMLKKPRIITIMQNYDSPSLKYFHL